MRPALRDQESLRLKTRASTSETNLGRCQPEQKRRNPGANSRATYSKRILVRRAEGPHRGVIDPHLRALRNALPPRREATAGGRRTRPLFALQARVLREPGRRTRGRAGPSARGGSRDAGAHARARAVLGSRRGSERSHRTVASSNPRASVAADPASGDFEEESDWRFEDEMQLGDTGASLDLPNGEAPALPNPDPNESSFAELGDPESWDLLSSPALDSPLPRPSPPMSPAVPTPQPIERVASKPPVQVPSEPVREGAAAKRVSEARAIVAGFEFAPAVRGGAWFAVAALVALATWTSIVPAAPASAPQRGVVSLGALELSSRARAADRERGGRSDLGRVRRAAQSERRTARGSRDDRRVAAGSRGRIDRGCGRDAASCPLDAAAA